MDQTCIGFTSGSLACASCHLPDQGWTTNSPLSPAYPTHMERRNSQTLINVAYNKALIWVGRAGVLPGSAAAQLPGQRSRRGGMVAASRRPSNADPSQVLI